MSVPNTNTFTQRDVVSEIYGDSRDESLQSLFSAATGTFDPAYQGSKNSLYNFRNYSHLVISDCYLYMSISPMSASSANVSVNTGGISVASNVYIEFIVLKKGSPVLTDNMTISNGTNSQSKTVLIDLSSYSEIRAYIMSISPSADSTYNYIAAN